MVCDRKPAPYCFDFQRVFFHHQREKVTSDESLPSIKLIYFARGGYLFGEKFDFGELWLKNYKTETKLLSS